MVPNFLSVANTDLKGQAASVYLGVRANNDSLATNMVMLQRPGSAEGLSELSTSLLETDTK